jgi:hypothetical protein
VSPSERFASCRWHQAAADGLPAHCTHRDVLPVTGAQGFSPDAWCGDCAFYKARRIVRRPDRQSTDDWAR